MSIIFQLINRCINTISILILFISCNNSLDFDPREDIEGIYEGTCEVISGNNQGEKKQYTVELYIDKYFQSKETLFLSDGAENMLIEIIDDFEDKVIFRIMGSVRLDNDNNAFQYYGYNGFQSNGSLYPGKIIKKDNIINYYIETDYINDELDSLNAIYEVVAIKTTM